MYDGRSDHYLAVGMSALHCIEAALEVRTPDRILDLPCGFGRVTRFLRARYPEAQITVSDLDRPGVDFAAAHFGARGVYSVEDLADLDFGTVFDLIWIGSLVTHLSEAQTRSLLTVMHRSMAPDATLVVSSHGPTIVRGLQSWLYGLEPTSAAAVLDGYMAAGYGHRGYGDSDGYGISLTDRHWWQQAAGEAGFELVSYEVQAWDGHQDILALRRSTNLPGAAAVTLTELQAEIAQERRRVAEYDGRLLEFDTAYYLAANPGRGGGRGERRERVRLHPLPYARPAGRAATLRRPAKAGAAAALQFLRRGLVPCHLPRRGRRRGRRQMSVRLRSLAGHGEGGGPSAAWTRPVALASGPGLGISCVRAPIPGEWFHA